jgi:hypothetical protein
MRVVPNFSGITDHRMGLACGVCCPKKPTISTDIDEVQALVTNSTAKEEISALMSQPRGTPIPPLLADLRNTFKSAADIDSSSSPLEDTLLDELGGASGSSDEAEKAE